MNKSTLFIILFHFVLLSGCQTLQTVDKAVYQATESVSDEDRITGERSLNIRSRENQIQLSNSNDEKAIEQFLKDGGKINEDVDSESYKKLKSIVSKIISVSHFDTEKWNVYLLSGDVFNAFVTGGTNVFVYEGLLKQANSEDEIAAVIGHEIAHIAANHVYEREAQLTALMLANSGSAKQQGYIQSFTNLNEQEADQVGILYSALAGYNPYAASELWGRLAQKESGLTLYFRTHPSSRERTIETRKIAESVSQYYSKGTINNQSNEILVCNTLWCKKEMATKPGEGGGFISLLNTSLNAYLDHLKAKNEKKRQEYEIAKSSYQLNIIGTWPNGSKISGSIYSGNAGVNDVTMDIQTQFALTKDNQVYGGYIFNDGKNNYKGSLQFNGFDNKTGFASFEYRDATSFGTAVFQFSNDGTAFRGVWKNMDGTNVNGTWDGKLD